MVEQDQGVAHPPQGRVPARPAFIEQSAEPHVGLERLAGGHLEPSIHEDLSIGTVVVNIDASLAEAERQGMIRQPRPAGEPRGLVGISQRRGKGPEPPPFARGAEEPAGERRDDQQPDQAGQHGACSEAHQVPRSDSRAIRPRARADHSPRFAARTKPAASPKRFALRIAWRPR